MFTPQRKGWGWSPSTPASGRSGAGVVLGRDKGKGVVGSVEPLPPPPQGSLGDAGNGLGGGEDVEVWRRFREAGFLDESVLQRRDREALAQRISELESELHDYQYNMGLLLIEKKEWTWKYEEMRQGLAESEEILKREQAAHLIAVSELEKREDHMRKAFGVEKQCVADLEKALREIRSENAEFKFTSDKKLAEAHALEASLEEKSLEIERKLHLADAQLAEARRKSSDVDRKLEELEARERKIQREYVSLNTGKMDHEKELAKQREHLRKWESDLHDRQRRLADEQSSMNEREARANEADRLLKKKEEELEEARKRIEISSNSLKEKEQDLYERLQDLASKEEDTKTKQVNLEKKEKDLIAWEERLDARERVEIQKLLEDHASILDAKGQEFELEMDQRRKSLDEELKSKLEAVERKTNEVNVKQEQVNKREQVLDCKMKELKVKEEELDCELKAFSERERTISIEESQLDAEKKRLANDTQELLRIKAELEGIKSTIEAEEERIRKENENLTVTAEERNQFLLLQSELRKEIEDCRIMKESLLKRSEDLRQERGKFESEWEALDEKKVQFEFEIKQFNDEKQRFERWQHNEEERLKTERLNARADAERELQELELKKQAFENLMAQERAEALEMLRAERVDIAQELDRLRHDLEIDMQKKQEEMEGKLKDKENEFESIRQIELNNIRSSSNLNESISHKLKAEQVQLDKEKEGLMAYRTKLETDQLDIRKDIDTLCTLSKNLKVQREEFVKEREHFLAVADRCKICRNCGVAISELELVGLQPLKEIEDAGNIILPSLADGYLEEHMKGKSTEKSPLGTGSPVVSGSRMSWLRKCSKIFSFSPGQKAERSPEGQARQSPFFGVRLEEASEDGAGHEPAPSFRVANDSFDTQRAQSDSEIRENEEPERIDKNREEREPSLGIADNSMEILRVHTDNGIQEMGAEPVVPSNNEQNEREESSLAPEDDSQPQPSKQRRRQPGRKDRPKPIKRTRTIKAVVEDAKAILGENADENKGAQRNGGTKDSLSILEDSQGDSVHANQVGTRARQKKRPATTSLAASELDAEDSEARSDSVSHGGRHKRRQTSAPGVQTPGEKRYNLRRSTIASTVAAAQATTDHPKGLNTGKHSPEDHAVKVDDDDGEGTSKATDRDPLSSGFVGEEAIRVTLQKTMVESVVEVHDMSSQKIVRFGMEETRDEDIVVKSVESSDQSGEDGEEVDGEEADAAAPTTPSRDGSDDDDGSSDDDSEKHNASVGKKLWNFFTT